MNDSSLSTTVSRLVDTLSNISVPFHLTGGLVASYYGRPRMTVDIDVVVRVESDADVLELVHAIRGDFTVDPESAQASLRTHRMFQALDKSTYFKIDFHIGERIPEELDRSVRVELFQGTTAPICSAEDAVVSKLQWYNMGSERSWQDALHIVRRQKGRLDEALLRTLAGRLELSEQLSRLLAEGHDDE